MNQAVRTGGPQLSPTDMNRIAKILKADAGIEIPEGKTTLVQARLTRRLRATGAQDYHAYCALLEGPDSQAEREHLLSALTTNVTKFFREDHHFGDLKARILPPLLQRARDGGTVRIWSAGCSSGEEPYSLAMTVAAAEAQASERDIRILATDIDPKMIAAGRAGTYRQSAIEGISQAGMTRWFDKVDEDHVRVKAEIRRMVTFNRLNLHADWPMKRAIDVIFCRNVVIYFDKEHETRLWQRMVSALAPDGRIFVGHSERIPSNPDIPVTLDGVTTYRKTTPIFKQGL